VEEELKKIQKGVDSSFLENKLFLANCIEKEHHTTFVDTLVSLYPKDPQFVKYTLLDCKTSSFHEFLVGSIGFHIPSKRCVLYRHVLKDRKQRDAYQTEVPWKCCDCLAWILRQQKACGLYDAFVRGLLNNRLTRGSENPTQIINMMTSLHIHHKKPHVARLLFDVVRKGCSEIEAQNILIGFLKQPYFQKDEFEQYIPMMWAQQRFVERIEKEQYGFIKKRNWVFKEELMMKTWHPDRFVRWCLDLDELQDFDLS
jgi:hypothetical protein